METEQSPSVMENAESPNACTPPFKVHEHDEETRESQFGTLGLRFSILKLICDDRESENAATSRAQMSGEMA